MSIPIIVLLGLWWLGKTIYWAIYNRRVGDDPNLIQLPRAARTAEEQQGQRWGSWIEKNERINAFVFIVVYSLIVYLIPDEALAKGHFTMAKGMLSFFIGIAELLPVLAFWFGVNTPKSLDAADLFAAPGEIPVTLSAQGIHYTIMPYEVGASRYSRAVRFMDNFVKSTWGNLKIGFLTIKEWFVGTSSDRSQLTWKELGIGLLVAALGAGMAASFAYLVSFVLTKSYLAELVRFALATNGVYIFVWKGIVVGFVAAVIIHELGHWIGTKIQKIKATPVITSRGIEWATRNAEVGFTAVVDRTVWQVGIYASHAAALIGLIAAMFVVIANPLVFPVIAITSFYFACAEEQRGVEHPVVEPKPVDTETKVSTPWTNLMPLIIQFSIIGLGIAMVVGNYTWARIGLFAFAGIVLVLPLLERIRKGSYRMQAEERAEVLKDIEGTLERVS